MDVLDDAGFDSAFRHQVLAFRDLVELAGEVVLLNRQAAVEAHYMLAASQCGGRRNEPAPALVTRLRHCETN